jgi:hypothetical protein
MPSKDALKVLDTIMYFKFKYSDTESSLRLHDAQLIEDYAEHKVKEYIKLQYEMYSNLSQYESRK